MPRTSTVLVTVSGATRFPIDMLRYDSAIPYSEEDSAAIESTWSFSDTNIGRASVRVLMPRPPTAQRWASFGWRIDLMEIE